MASSGEQDKSSKTEEPTSKRLEEAYKEGNFAKAEEIQVVFALAAGFIIVLFYLREVGLQLARFMQGVFGNLSHFPLNVPMVVATGRDGIGQILLLVAPVAGAAVIAGILAGGLQSGFKLSPKAIALKGSKLNPINGFKQRFGKQVFVKFALDLLKLLAIAGVIAYGIRRVTRHPIFHTRIEVIQIGSFIFETTLYLVAILIVAMTAIAVIHFLYQKHKVHQELMMTRQEVMDERKQQEGDPLVKSAQKRMALRLVQRQMFEAIPGADVVITNPTHYAVALRYDRTQDSAPVLLAKGRNLIAEKIKRIAGGHGIPIVENKPAAQALYKIGQVGKPIPQQLYQVVAEVLAYVYRAHRRFFLRRGRLHARAAR